MLKKTAIALGTFDGLHLGHIEVLNHICKSGYEPLALTFDTPPKMTDSKSFGLILTPDAKKRILLKKGIKAKALDFKEIKNFSPTDFLNMLLEKYNPALISCGFNFRFGKDAAGDGELIKSFCDKNFIKCSISNPVLEGGEPISSTRIRKAIEGGDIASANKMLGRPFSFTNTVIHGDRRGRTIGFPTINQKYPSELIVPRFGVYSGYAKIDNKQYNCIINIGKRPTFATDYIISESHLLDFDDDIYGKEVTICLTSFLRDEVKFNGIEELKNAIAADKKKAEMEFK